MTQGILIVEDEPMTARLLKREVEAALGLPAAVAHTFHATRETLERSGRDAFSAALVDYHLPDAPQGEALDYLLAAEVPCIVFTGDFSDELREQMVAKRVIDYVLKENAASVQHAVRVLRRIHLNRSVQVLVVDDSRTARHYLAGLLRRHRFQVLEAGGGEEALELLDRLREVHLVITDYHMPGMDGFELTRRIRAKFDMNRLAIIGLSAHGTNLLSAGFLKHGANDFIAKPFLEEEFFCRVSQNVVLMETIRQLEEASIRDWLTGLHNRRYFNEAGQQLFASMRRGQLELVVGVLDLDFFKRINDSLGHDAGDAVLKGVAQVLQGCVRETDILARMGGEEFSLLLVNPSAEGAAGFFERTRMAVEAARFPYQGRELRVTASFGVCTRARDSLSAMVSAADDLLYRAKAEGRNRVVVEP